MVDPSASPIRASSIESDGKNICPVCKLFRVFAHFATCCDFHRMTEPRLNLNIETTSSVLDASG